MATFGLSLPPGVPPLLKPPSVVPGITNASNVTTPLRADSRAARNTFADSPWGIFRNGARVIKPDSILSVDYRQDTRVSDYPLEEGSFETYSKVGTPFEIQLRMTKGGSNADRSAFLKQCEDLVNSFEVYEVVTPEKVYINVNVQRYDYARSSTNGVGLLTVDLSLIEIRRFAKSVKVNNGRAPGAAPQVDRGRVQAQPVTDFVGRIPSGTNLVRPPVTQFQGVIR